MMSSGIAKVVNEEVFERVKEALENIGYTVVSWERLLNINYEYVKFILNGNTGSIDLSLYHTGTALVQEKEKRVGKQLKSFVEDVVRDDLKLSPYNKEIAQIINDNVEKGRQVGEGEHFDFKEDLSSRTWVKTLMALANTRGYKNSYLIFGINNENGEFVDIEKSFSKDNLDNTLKNVNFAGDRIPDYSLERINYQCNELPVIVCKESDQAPFYAISEGKSKQKYKEGVIYTRAGSSTGIANDKDVQKLWKIHFGIEKLNEYKNNEN